MTDSPSVTEEVFATALPPARSLTPIQLVDPSSKDKERTLDNLVNHLLGGCAVEVVHNDIGTSTGEGERVAGMGSSAPEATQIS